IALAPGFGTDFLRNMRHEALQMDQPILHSLGPEHEARTYLAMARAIDGDPAPFSKLLALPVGFDLKIAGGEPFLERCNGRPRVIVLWLHTWSFEMWQLVQQDELLGLPDACLIAPNFNGAGGSNPLSCGSPDSLDRIRRVVEDVRAQYGKLPVVAAGASGGGFHALLTLGTYPRLIPGPSIWVPPYD